MEAIQAIFLAVIGLLASLYIVSKVLKLVFRDMFNENSPEIKTLEKVFTKKGKSKGKTE